MPDPAQLHGAHIANAIRGAKLSLDGVHHGGIDGVHEAAVDLPGGVTQYDEDGDGDREADDGVGPVPAEGHAAGTEQYGERGEPIGAGV